jgi:membrane-associated phospholipid phosphatase
MRAFFIWLGCLVGTSAVVIAAYFWFDRPIVLFVRDVLRHHYSHVIVSLREFPDPLVPLSVVVFVILGLMAFLGRRFSRHETTAFLVSISIIMTETIKDNLKFIFGRSWPEDWIRSNGSFLHDRVYGFHFFHGGIDYRSFPSGHMAATCAALAVLWVWYPRLRWLWTIASIMVGTALVGTNYHFVSDVIAGAFVGVSVGWIIIVIWNQRINVDLSDGDRGADLPALDRNSSRT